MRGFENHIPTRIMTLAAVASFALSQANNAIAAPATDLLKQAQLLRDQHQDTAALACLNTLIKQQPANAQAYSNRAAIFIETERYRDALNDSDRAVALKPRLAAAYAVRGLAYGGAGKLQKTN